MYFKINFIEKSSETGGLVRKLITWCCFFFLQNVFIIEHFPINEMGVDVIQF